jgi:hypothetical protein
MRAAIGARRGVREKGILDRMRFVRPSPPSSPRRLWHGELTSPIYVYNAANTLMNVTRFVLALARAASMYMHRGGEEV